MKLLSDCCYGSTLFVKSAPFSTKGYKGNELADQQSKDGSYGLQLETGEAQQVPQQNRINKTNLFGAVVPNLLP